ncbi:MAG: serine/threonine protein kinase [Gemmataceae bacterium]
MDIEVCCHNGHSWKIPIPNQHNLQNPTPTCPECGSGLTAESYAIIHNLRSDSSPDSGTTKDLTVRLHQTSTDNQPSGPSTQVGLETPLPGYELVRVLGSGGMGTVYEAKQIGLNRMVAVKMIHGAGSTHPISLARFQTEAKAVAQLHHPNIVQIYDIGDSQGQPFLSLELVEGGNLSKRLQHDSFSPRKAAQLLETVARAIHFAHRKGIVHRDLKPGNILLTADETPKVTDFGLAKRLTALDEEHSTNITQTGEVLGTPSYMAPEQAAALHGEIGPATDVYSLGAVLYKMLTGKAPFEGSTPMQIVLRVLDEEPVLPKKLRPKIPNDLQTICVRCLQKDPRHRYPSAQALAEDLKAYLSGEPIQTRPIARWDRLIRWMRRRPLAAALAGIGTVATLGILVGIWWYSVLTIVGLAVLSLLIGAWWYSARLQIALRRINEQHQEAERNVQRMHLLLETNQQLMKAQTLEEILRHLTEATTRMVNAERATIYVIDEANDELWSKVALGDNVGEIRVHLGLGIAGTVALTGETIHLEDPYSDSRFNPEIDRRTGYTTRNLLTFPMKDELNDIIGVFQVLNKRTGPFESEDMEFLQALSRSAAIAVERAKAES